MKVFVTGLSGGLGREFLPYGVAGCSGSRRVGDFPVADLTRPGAAESILAEVRPDVVIHTVGWVDVDACEADPERAAAVNFQTLLHVRRCADRLGFRIVFISTNDVFRGSRGRYREEDRPDPVNVYAMTKAAAETLLRPEDLIVRAALLAWNCNGKVSFVRWLVEALERGESPSLFRDQYTSPVTVTTLARLILERFLGERGILHVGTERRSRFEVGRGIAAALGLPAARIRPGALAAHRFLAPRPRDVSLDSDRAARRLGGPLRLEAELEVLRRTRPVPRAVRAGASR
ncbi:MAG: SDR family oxidoreductase [Acidobacteria bacterium]|nr:SDR family oxidoreductase [Acidobacteriota bacterium]